VVFKGSAERFEICAEWIGKAMNPWSGELNNRVFALNEQEKALNCYCEWCSAETLKICAELTAKALNP